MPKYYVSKNAQENGDYHVHQEGCRLMPVTEERIYLGEFKSCTPAVLRAKNIFKTSDGCRKCSRPCLKR